ncbi:MAG: RodZ domain-containing protein [Pseudomonadota bacterium]
MNAVSQSLTSSSPSQTAGVMLADARRAKNIDLIQVSGYLRLALWQVEALENDQYGRLAGPTFIRGIIRSYAKALGIDPQPALDAYSRIVPADVQHVAINVPSQNIRFDPTSLNGWGISNKVGLIFLAVVVIAASLGIWYIPPKPKSVVNKVASEQQNQPVQEAALPMNRSVSSVPTIAPPATATILGNAPATTGSPVEKTGAPAAVGLTASSSLVVNQSPVQPANTVTGAQSTPVFTPANIPPVIKSETAVAAGTAGSSVHPGPVVTAPAVAPVTVSGKSSLRLTFQNKSWVEVKDGNKKIIFRELNSPNSERVLNGKPPFTLVIGNAASVRLFYNDKPIDLAPFTEVHVARLIVE